MTTTRRLLAAVLLSTALTTSAAAGALASTPPPAGEDGVRITVDIPHRESPASPRVAVLGAGPFVVGGEIVVRATGLTPLTAHEVWLHSDPVLLGTGEVAADGTLELTVTVPPETLPGWHHLEVREPAVGTVATSDPFEIVAAPGPGAPADPDGPDGPHGPDDTGTVPGTSASPGPGGLATTGAGLAAAAVVAAVAVASGVALRRRAARGV